MEKNISQERLSIEAHVDQSGLSKFERGKDTKLGRPGLARIAQVLGLSVEELVRGTSSEELGR
jgi:transcriptional regulator with XRE-family HTH domain